MRWSAGEWIFSSDANANFEGLLVVNRGICMPQMAEKASPDAPPNCAVVPQCNIRSINSFGKEVFRSFIHGKVLLVHQSTQKDPVVNILSPDICIAHLFSQSTPTLKVTGSTPAGRTGENPRKCKASGDFCAFFPKALLSTTYFPVPMEKIHPCGIFSSLPAYSIPTGLRRGGRR